MLHKADPLSCRLSSPSTIYRHYICFPMLEYRHPRCSRPIESRKKIFSDINTIQTSCLATHLFILTTKTTEVNMRDVVKIQKSF